MGRTKDPYRDFLRRQIYERNHRWWCDTVQEDQGRAQQGWHHPKLWEPSPELPARRRDLSRGCRQQSPPSQVSFFASLRSWEEPCQAFLPTGFLPAASIVMLRWS